MACGCGGGGSAKQENYVYTSPTGVQKQYRSEVEAKAAQIRAGGGGNIRAVSR